MTRDETTAKVTSVFLAGLFLLETGHVYNVHGVGRERVNLNLRPISAPPLAKTDAPNGGAAVS